MNHFKKIMSLCLCMLLLLTSIPAAFAAEVEGAALDPDAKCSLTIWKYDYTNARKDGVWNEDSFVSSGWQESYVEEALGSANRKGGSSAENALGNGQTSNGYAIKGVGFTLLRVADIVTFTEENAGEHGTVQVLYGFDKDKSAGLLSAICLGEGAGRYENADGLDTTKYYYTADALNKALSDSLTANSTTVKDALETYIKGNGGLPMPLTDENGKTIVRDLPVGLYLTVETSVPEMVTSTTAPFFTSLPMTAISGDANSASPEGGTQWNYNVVIYPKQETGIPTLEKLVREAKADTGKHNGSDSISDGFAHNATGSAGDIMEYEILSTLPTITSQATALTTYSFFDTICEGLNYCKDAKDVKIEFFKDAACTEKVASWDMDSGKFSVTYTGDDHSMTIDITDAGLAEINGGENANGSLYAGYSNYTARVLYTAKINSDASFVYGADGNDNQVVLTWKRTSSEYYDTLVDDCHVTSFGIDLTKLFSDKDAATAEETGMYKHVKFKVKNATDNYWLVAERNDKDGMYYVTGHTTEEADATVFSPVTAGGKPGKVIIKGCEDDEYVITETATASGYTLLKEPIHVVITAAEDKDRACDIYSKDILGVLQNDPRYAFDGGQDLKLQNIPQKALAHTHLTASATVDGKKVNMISHGESKNAGVPLTVRNTKGFDLPQTGDSGTMPFVIIGVLLMAGTAFVIVLTYRKKKI